MSMVYDVGTYQPGMIIDGVAASRTKYYATWCSMLARCYSEKEKPKNPAYSGCTVSESWLTFSNFYDWASRQKYFLVQDYYLDKDILHKGNKIYASDTCCVVPREINNLFTRREKCRGKYPIGVSYHPQNHNLIATMAQNGKKVHIGSFTDEVEAFLAYKEAKEKYIKLLAEKYAGKIDDNVYKALCEYVVDIED